MVSLFDANITPNFDQFEVRIEERNSDLFNALLTEDSWMNDSSSEHVFFSSLYGRCDKDAGEIIMTQGPSRIKETFGASQWKMAAYASICGQYDFLKYNPQDLEKLTQGSVGKASTVKTVVALGLDVDANKEDFGSREEVLSVLVNMPTPPTMIVNSSANDGGFHVYWCLLDPVQIQDDEHRQRVAAIFKRFENMLRDQLGGKLDATSNLDRLLRPAGSVNSKYGKQVNVHSYSDKLYALEDLEETCPQREPAPSVMQDVPFATYSDDSIGTQFNQSWDGVEKVVAIMEGLGYDLRNSRTGRHYEFNRPGSESNMANGNIGKLSDGGNYQLISWSPNTPFEVGKSITIFQALADLCYGGSTSDAAVSLLEEQSVQAIAGYVEPEFVSKHVQKAQDSSALNDSEEAADLSEYVDADCEGPLPEELMNVGGFIGELTSWINENCELPTHEMNFAMAIHLLSLAAGRRYRDDSKHQTHPNLYNICVSGSGTGKDGPRKAGQAFLGSVGHEQLIGPVKFSSGPGLVDLVSTNKVAGAMLDEVGDLLGLMSGNKAEGYMKQLNQDMKTLYSAASNPFWKGSQKVNDDTAAVAHPFLSIHGATTPQRMYDNLSQAQIEDGFVGRLLIFEGPQITEEMIDQLTFDGVSTDPPVRLMRAWKSLKKDASICEMQIKDGTEDDLKEEIDWVIVPRSSAAVARLREHYKDIMKRNLKHQKDGDQTSNNIWSRASEKSAKLTLLIALSRYAMGGCRLEITLDDANRGIALSNFLTRRFISRLQLLVVDNELEKFRKSACKAILRWMEKKGGEHVPVREMKRRTPFTQKGWKSAQDSAVQDLADVGLIVIGGSGNKTTAALTEDGMKLAGKKRK